MVQIQISGPSHARKGYVMVEITRALREFGCDVQLQGETTHLEDKTPLTDEEIKSKLNGVTVIITELKTP